MCSNDNWTSILGGLAAAAVILVSAYTNKHSVHTQAHAAPAAISAPASSGAQTPGAL